MEVPKEPSEPLLTRPAAQTAQKRKCINSDTMCCGMFFILTIILTFVGFALFCTNYSISSSDSHQFGITLTDKHGTRKISTDELINLLLDDHKQREAEQHVLEDVTLDDNSTFLEPITKKPQNSAKCERRIVCVFDLDATKDFKEPTDEQLSMLTHITFYPLELHSNGTIAIRSGRHLEVFERLVKRAKVHGVKLMISTVELRDNIMEHITKNEEKRKNLMDSLLEIIESYNLDGVDVHWQWTYMWQQEVNLVALCKRLRDNLNNLYLSTDRENPFIISVTTGLDSSQDPRIEDVSKYIDFFNIKTDINNGGFGAGAMPRDFVREQHEINVNLQYYSCLLNNPNKLNLVIRFYQTEWHHLPDTKDGLGFLRKSPFSIQGARKQLKEKLNYVMDKNIGGWTIWRIQNDHPANTLLGLVSTTRKCSRKTHDNTVKFGCD